MNSKMYTKKSDRNIYYEKNKIFNYYDWRRDIYQPKPWTTLEWPIRLHVEPTDKIMKVKKV